ncbi:hypothetical protein DM01DRAFT_1407851 [Hesseltinella vesiculosa]|uniref:BZIP domain-containing protein n=1 Tax=Hesseltinella vesiculosa TaxID=101127 RepID=A0A1X2GG54_9FUNG|nr:hypothetical protein DM01DRAFT_1407851 [Hesseltinella vesiculosa]
MNNENMSTIDWILQLETCPEEVTSNPLLFDLETPMTSGFPTPSLKLDRRSEHPPSTAKKLSKPHSNEAFSGKLDFRPTMTDHIPEHQLKSMSPKERRQLRNKISARNFRNRRKEYIESIEEQLDDQKQENEKLRSELATMRNEMDQLRDINQQLRLDLVLYEQGVRPMPLNPAMTTPPLADALTATTPPTAIASATTGLMPIDDLFTTSSSSSSGDSSPNELMLMESSPLVMDASWPPAFNMFLSHALFPDLSLPLSNKSMDTNLAPNVMEVFQRYPLLAPALMSIVVGHTMTLSTDDLLRLNFSTQTVPTTSDKEMFKVWELLEPSLQAAMTTIDSTTKAIDYYTDDEDDDQFLDAPVPEEDDRADGNPSHYCAIRYLRNPVCAAHRYMKDYVCALVHQCVEQYVLQQQQEQQQRQHETKCSIYATFRRCKERFVTVS